MKTATYARFSTDRQNESSIADQVRVCREYAASQGWRVVDHFEDQGISGAALGNRPGALRLLEAALAGRVDVVLVTDLSRLSRSQGDLAKTIDRLVARGVRIIGVQEGYDSARRGHKLQAGLSGIIGEAFRDMVKERTYTALESRARTSRPTGGRAFGYRADKVDPDEAVIVREIFERFADGTSCKAIAAELNARGVPSPGSTWNRSERRCSGWMGSAVRAMILNDRYTGLIAWNRSQWVKDPDSGKRIRRERPASEWITHRDESLRIISDELWQRAQLRLRPAAADVRLKCGGKPKYLLSGLLVCGECGAHYTITGGESYGCPTFHDGRACTNGVRVRRDRAEGIILGNVKDGLLAPERVAKMEQEMRSYYLERVRVATDRAEAAPQELTQLDARIDRLRGRLAAGDPDMTPDEIQAAIERAEAKRKELELAQPAAKATAKVFAMMPRAAEEYRRQIELGLSGDARAAGKARVILRNIFGGKIRLFPQADGGLIADYALQQMALLQGVGTCGSGGVLCDVPAVPIRQRIK